MRSGRTGSFSGTRPGWVQARCRQIRPATRSHSGASDVSAAIAASAGQAFGPLGLTRKGRSRIWLDDHGWWLGVVEFQPSAWGPGSYLNVGAMFLWRPTDHLAFEIGNRVADFSPADDLADFQVAVETKVEQAAQAVLTLRQRLRNLGDVIGYFAARTPTRRVYEAAHLGTAYMLAGDIARGQHPRGCGRRDHLRDWVTGTMNSTRAALRLPAGVDAPTT